MTGLSEEALALIPDREWTRGSGVAAPRYKVLDHGYVSVKNVWGSDEEIVETARMSTDKGFLGWDPGVCPSCDGRGTASDGLGVQAGGPSPCHDCGGKGKIPGDAKLLSYLYANRHSTPFEFGGLTIEVQAPLMVYREWHRHRTQSYSEMSARYVQMPNLHYVPSIERIIASAQKSKNRQASGSGVIAVPGIEDKKAAAHIQHLIRGEQLRIYDLYEQLLSFGVAKEVARLDTPVSRYSRMRATTDLRNWLAFLTLRMDPHAQFEIRQYAWCVADAIATSFPRTYELFFKDMLPVFEPELAPKKLLTDALDVLGVTYPELREPEGAGKWGARAAELSARIRRALGKAA
jgi:thymidylate synthase (FAD)